MNYAVILCVGKELICGSQFKAYTEKALFILVRGVSIMKLLYEKELAGYLAQSDSEVLRYAKELIDSNNAINWQKSNELSYLLRRNNRHDLAVEISRMMFEKDPTVDKLNLYFVAVVDQGSIEEIKKLHALVDDYVRRLNCTYQKHLFATWLKAANRILDDQMFNYVYDMVPSTEKIENSYIISQYYVYLNRHSRYNDVKEHFESQLAPHVQNSKFVFRYYRNACTRLGYIYKENNEQAETPSLRFSPETPDKDTTPTSADKRVFLVYGNKPSDLSTIKFFLKTNNIDFTDLAADVTGDTILSKFEAHASESRFAIVLLTPEDHVVRKDPSGKEEDVYYPRQNVVLEWGYFLGKLGKEHVAVLLQEQGRRLHKDFIVPSDMLGTEHISLASDWLPKLAQRLNKSGFAVSTDAFH